MLVLTVLFMMISLIIVFGLVNPTLRNIRIVSDLLKSKQSLLAADSGVADAIYRVKNNITISNQEILSLNGSFSTTTLVDTLGGKTITSIGDNQDYIRKIKINLLKGTGVSFFYGVQAGEGGFVMSGSAVVDGNIYSNGIIEGGTVTGSAISAGPLGSIHDTHVGENGVGIAHAHNVTDSTVAGELRCKVDGGGNNKSCNTSYSDPEPIAMPVTAEQIDEWQAEASVGNPIIGDYTPAAGASLGPKRITGNLIINNSITITGTVWVEGVLSFGTKGEVKLASDVYGANSGVIMVDKYTTFSGGSQIKSTGVPGSFVMLLVTSDCPASSFCSDNKAISASGNAGSVVLAAPYGTIDFTGNSSAKEVIANKVILGGNTEINYELGLANMNFVSGPAGGYHTISFMETE